MPRTNLWIVLGCLLVIFWPTYLTQSIEDDNQQQTWTGHINVMYGDPVPARNHPNQFVTILSDENGHTIGQLAIPEAQAQAYDGRIVEVAGGLASTLPDALPMLDVEHILSLDNADDGQRANLALAGTYPWVNVLCKFSDVPEVPHEPAYYQLMFNNSYPGLDHFWRQVSYGNVNVAGSQTTTQWYTLPRERTYYVPDGPDAARLKWQVIAEDCADAADVEVNFPQFAGINFIFNANLDCCAWGGSSTLNRDGQSITYRTTWIPANAQLFGYFAHEMGHGFGLPHSSGPNNEGTLWDVMGSGGMCIRPHPQFGCISVGTIAYHLDKLNWIPAHKRAVVTASAEVTLTLERLRLPEANTNHWMAKVLIGNSTSRFYTVETRKFTGYDVEIPGEAVVIHDVDVNRSDAHAFVVDGDGNNYVNDAGAMWLPGETFTDAANNIEIEVLSATASTYTVRISNHSALLQTAPESPSDFRATNASGRSLTLAWHDNSYREDGYRIYRWNGFEYRLLTTVGANQTSYVDVALTCDQNVFYEISAYNSYGESERAGFATRTGACQSANAVPQLNPFNTNTPTLSWGAVTWAKGYVIEISTAADFSAVVQTKSAAPDQLSLATDYLGENTYYWRVRAQDSAGKWGAWSVTASFTIDLP